jgi:hypothetical protein
MPVAYIAVCQWPTLRIGRSSLRRRRQKRGYLLASRCLLRAPPVLRSSLLRLVASLRLHLLQLPLRRSSRFWPLFSLRLCLPVHKYAQTVRGVVRSHRTYYVPYMRPHIHTQRIFKDDSKKWKHIVVQPGFQLRYLSWKLDYDTLVSNLHYLLPRFYRHLCRYGVDAM